MTPALRALVKDMARLAVERYRQRLEQQRQEKPIQPLAPSRPARVARKSRAA